MGLGLLCEACNEPASEVYQMLTVPGPEGRIAVCPKHAETMKNWGGHIAPVLEPIYVPGKEKP